MLTIIVEITNEFYTWIAVLYQKWLFFRRSIFSKISKLGPFKSKCLQLYKLTINYRQIRPCQRHEPYVDHYNVCNAWMTDDLPIILYITQKKYLVIFFLIFNWLFTMYVYVWHPIICFFYKKGNVRQKNNKFNFGDY